VWANASNEDLFQEELGSLKKALQDALEMCIKEGIRAGCNAHCLFCLAADGRWCPGN